MKFYCTRQLKQINNKYKKVFELIQNIKTNRANNDGINYHSQSKDSKTD